MEIMLVLFSFYQRKIYSENFKKGCNCFEGAIFVLYDDYSHFSVYGRCNIIFQNIFLKYMI